MKGFVIENYMSVYCLHGKKKKTGRNKTFDQTKNLTH